MKYEAPYGVTDQNASYVNGNPAAGIKGSIPPAAAMEYPQREIVSLISNSDFVPSDNDLSQLLKSVRRQHVNFAVDQGAVNSLVVNLTPALDVYHAGFPLRVLVAVTNTGAGVINVNALGTRAIKRGDGSDLHAGDLVAGMICTLVDTGSVFQLQNPMMGVASTSNSYYINIPYVADTGVANAIVAPFSPAITAVTEGEFISVKVKVTNTAATTIQVNALAPVSICRDDGTNVQAGDLLANEQILLENHSTYWQVVGLVRSQVMLPPAPLLRGIIASASGYGAQYIPTSSATTIAYYNVEKNNLQTSTFDGFTLTIGAGENGVWDLYGSVHAGFCSTDSNYSEIIIFRNYSQGGGVEIGVESAGYIQANTGNQLSANTMCYLNVGDQVQVKFYQQGAPLYTGPNDSTRFSAWLVSK